MDFDEQRERFDDDEECDLVQKETIEQDDSDDDLFNPGTTTIGAKPRDKLGNIKGKKLRTLLEEADSAPQVSQTNDASAFDADEDSDVDFDKEFEELDKISGEELKRRWNQFSGYNNELKEQLPSSNSSNMDVEEFMDTSNGRKRNTNMSSSNSKRSKQTRDKRR